jgi:hypothetical protein
MSQKLLAVETLKPAGLEAVIANWRYMERSSIAMLKTVFK